MSAGAAALIPNTQEGTAEAGKQGGGKRGPRGPRTAKNAEENFLYSIEDPNKKGESGNIVLLKPGDKKDILAASLKHGVHYFRLQKFTASLELAESGKYEIVENPVTE